MIQIDIDMPKYCGECFVGNKTICRDGCPLKEVEPEKHYDEWCTDCKEYDRERHCCPRWNRVIREALNDAEAIPVSWIEERIKNAIKADRMLIARMWLELIYGYRREHGKQ